MTKELLNRLEARKQIYLVAGTYHDKLVARFVVCSRFSREEDIAFAWNEIVSQTTEILQEKNLYDKSIDTGKVSDEMATRIENLNQKAKILEKIS